jgi:uncharacterized tellurite resistance protein B-like protein
VLRAYTKNSPEAMARIIAMIMLSDADLDDAEIGVMDRLGVCDRIGVNRGTFIRVMKEYFDDLLREDTGKVRLIDAKRLDEVLDSVDDEKKQIDLSAILLNLISADGTMNDAELATLRHVLHHWGLTIEEIEASLSRN